MTCAGSAKVSGVVNLAILMMLRSIELMSMDILGETIFLFLRYFASINTYANIY